MIKNTTFDLQIIITSGKRDVEKATVGLAIALASAYCGGKVVIFLTMEGAMFACQEEGKIAYIPGFESVQKYFDLLIEAKVRIEACTTCVQNYCSRAETKTRKKRIRKGMVYAGLSTAAIRALKTQTLVF